MRRHARRSHDIYSRPYIAKVEPSVEVFARVDGRIVAAREGSQLAVAFHPELDDDLRMHQLFLQM